MPVIPSKFFYFIRHGRTDANAQGLTCGGDWDISLNSEGKEQALKAASRLIQLNPRPERIFVSPMQRALQTAEGLQAHLRLEIEIVEDLREWRVGEWETKPWGEVPNPFNTTEDPPGGEPREIFEKRIEAAVAGILNGFSGIALIVSHGAAAHALFTELGSDPFHIENCVFYRVAPEKRRWVVTPLG